MQIGIILYSQTGHTRRVALLTQDKLNASGHAVTLHTLEPVGQPGFSQDAQAPLQSIPSVEAYDALIFAAPVWGGNPAPPFLTFLNHTPGLQGKRVACLVTGFFPAQWGCVQAIAKMNEIAQSKGAQLLGSASVTWFSPTRGRQIKQAAEKLAALFA